MVEWTFLSNSWRAVFDQRYPWRPLGSTSCWLLAFCCFETDEIYVLFNSIQNLLLHSTSTFRSVKRNELLDFHVFGICMDNLAEGIELSPQSLTSSLPAPDWEASSDVDNRAINRDQTPYVSYLWTLRQFPSYFLVFGIKLQIVLAKLVCNSHYITPLNIISVESFI